MNKTIKNNSLRNALAPIFIASALLGFATTVSAGGPGDFDFWLGNWNLTWGSDGTATNQVSRELEGHVIHERFDGRPGSKLVGTSVSVYDAKKDVWRQTWVDNTGAYLDFTGSLNDDGSMELWRAGEDAEGNPALQRMVFYNIRRNSLDWNWERSTDGGNTWETLWKIHYERAP